MGEDWPKDLSDLTGALGDYLNFQKKLRVPGVPTEWVRVRRSQESSAAGEAPSKPLDSLSHRKDAEPTGPARAADSAPQAVSNVSQRHSPESSGSPLPSSPSSSVTLQGGLFDKPTERPTLESIREEMGDCRRCRLNEDRQTIVFGEGNPDAEIMFVGEGPGADEDASGRPFVGRAGQLLTKWIELGMGIPRKEVYIGNIVKCRPPGNRDPEKDEAAACIGFIRKQITAVHPKVLVLLGRIPLLYLLGVREGITKVHGTWFEYQGVPTMALFHPSYCLRPPQDEKRKIVWEDLKKILTFLGKPIPGKSPAR